MPRLRALTQAAEEFLARNADRRYVALGNLGKAIEEGLLHQGPVTDAEYEVHGYASKGRLVNPDASHRTVEAQKALMDRAYTMSGKDWSPRPHKSLEPMVLAQIKDEGVVLTEVPSVGSSGHLKDRHLYRVYVTSLYNTDRLSRYVWAHDMDDAKAWYAQSVDPSRWEELGWVVVAHRVSTHWA